ncbi:D-alanyl-D-alanine carboxypeptidase, partial [Mesorhizobium sp. M7A.F.Ca.AU.002.02.1.1]
MRYRHFLKLFSAGTIALSVVAGPALANPVVVFDLGSGKILQHQDAFKR